MFKKLFFMLALCSVSLGLMSCGGDEAESTAEVELTQTTTTDTEETTREETTTQTTSKETTKSTTKTTTQTTTKTTTTTKKRYDVESIIFPLVEYNQANDAFELSFNVKSSDMDYVVCAGTAVITISDDNGAQIFNQSIPFTENDFNTSAKQLCLTIPSSSITPSSTPSGRLYVSIQGEGFSTPQEDTLIQKLPEKKGQISLPATPATFQYILRNYTATLTVQSISYETKISYDGEMTAEFEFTVSLDGKTAKTEVAESCLIGFQLKDSEGIVVESGEIYCNEMWVGDKTKCNKIVFDLDPNEQYSLLLSNYER